MSVRTVIASQANRGIILKLMRKCNWERHRRGPGVRPALWSPADGKQFRNKWRDSLASPPLCSVFGGSGQRGMLVHRRVAGERHVQRFQRPKVEQSAHGTDLYPKTCKYICVYFHTSIHLILVPPQGLFRLPISPESVTCHSRCYLWCFSTATRAKNKEKEKGYVLYLIHY